LNSGLPLQPADVADDLLEFAIRYPLDPRHVAEVPVVGPDTPPGRQEKGCIAMVIGLINSIDKTWAVVRSGRRLSMTRSAIPVKSRLPFCVLFRQIGG